MNVFEELFANSKIKADGNAWTVTTAICALADEVRALRIVQQEKLDLTKADIEAEQEQREKEAKQRQESSRDLVKQMAEEISKAMYPPALATADYLKSTAPPPFASTAPFPFVTQAKSERIQYPYCDACESFHHPDDFLCKRLQPQPPAEQEESKS